MKKLLGALVIALASLVSGLTHVAAAAPSADPAETSAETPLHTRPSTPLDPAPPSSGRGWRLLAFAGVAAAGLWVWKRRMARSSVARRGPDLLVLRRTSLGMRSELVLIDVEGQRLLLGVAPHSIQTLYIVPETPAEDVASEPARGETSSAFARRLAGALDSREQGELPERETRPKTGKVTSAAKAPRGRPMQDEDDEDEVEEQARGLRALGARR